MEDMSANTHVHISSSGDGRRSRAVPILAVLLSIIVTAGAFVFIFLYLPFLTEYTEMKETHQKLLDENQSLTKKNSELQDMVSAAINKVDELQSSQLGLVEELAKMKDVYNSLLGSLKEEIEAGNAEIVQEGGRVFIKLKDAILFASGESNLNEEGYAVLDRIGTILRTLRGKQVVIEGHTDDRPIGESIKGRFPTNWELSTGRALSVLHYFVDRWGLDPALLSAVGYAEFRPVVPNSTEEGRARNRRIEIAILPMDIRSIRQKTF